MTTEKIIKLKDEILRTQINTPIGIKTLAAFETMEAAKNEI